MNEGHIHQAGPVLYYTGLYHMHGLWPAVLYDRNRDIMASRGHFFNDTSGLLSLVYLDFGRMCIVLQNLLDNARQYCSPGGDITIGVERTGFGICFYPEKQIKRTLYC